MANKAPPAHDIGTRIRLARERLGVTVTDLGYAFGGTRQRAQFWEKGRHLPAAAELPRLCALLGIDANHLLGVTPIMDRESAPAIDRTRRNLLAAAEAKRQQLAMEDMAHKAPSTKRVTRRIAR